MNILLRRRKLGNGSCNGIRAASKTGIDVVRNDTPFDGGVVNYVFRWGCTSNVPESATVINKASAIHWCSNKKQGRLDMQEAGVGVPRAMTAAEFMTREFTSEEYVPYVLRRAQHAQGRDLWHGGITTIREAIRQHGVQDGYVSVYISKVAEYRVMVVSNRVVWVAKKTPGNPEDVAWNVARGGKFDNVRWGEWPIEVVKEALKAANVSTTDFCGVDVMVDGDGKAYVLEVNSAPSQTSPYRQQCLAKAFDHIVVNGKDKFPDPRAITGWKSVIHPALLKDD